MNIQTSDYEKLGSFYLGRGYDLKKSELEDELVLYDSKDLVTHGVVLGMTGSGKTGLCLSILEEAAMDNIPAIIIDPKGDIANLMLTFPDFEGSDFRPWINEDDAHKKGVTPDEYAAKTANMWKEGIAGWGQSPDRVKEFKNKCDINIFTPGSKAGIPVSILSSLEVPPFEVMDDGELLGDRIESTVSSLLSLVGVNADPIQSPEAVILGTIFSTCWQAGQNLTLESLIRHLQKPPFDKVGVIDVESFMDEKERHKLALKFNSLLASPGFATWMEGPALDMNNMMHAPDGKPRISIFSIAHLSDAERMFFVSLLLNQMLGWMRSQNGTTSLRAMLYMDEIYGFLPPSQNPPSKKPMMTMLKQGRAFGLGVLLATQNPVDLDYKALSNIGTWWLGRLQTERDKARVLDGLEGAAASQEGGFDRGQMEELLAGLGSRVFLMNNVHEDSPVVFHVRWVMSYLCGPLTRTKIKELMDPKRDQFPSAKDKQVTAKQSSNPMAMPSAAPQAPVGQRPVVGAGVTEYFAPFAGEADGITYKPALLREANVHFSSSKCGIDGSRLMRFTNAISDNGIDWDHDAGCTHPVKTLDSKPRKGCGFEELPGFAMNADNYKQVEKDFEDHIYRNERVEIFYCPLFKSYSQLGESEGAFRGRLATQAREVRDEAVEKLRDKYEAKIKTKEGQVDRAENTLAKEEAEASSATWDIGAKVLGGLLGGLLGGRRRSSSSSAVTSAGRAYKQRRDVKIAEKKVEDLEEDIAELEAELNEEIGELDAQFDPSTVKLENEAIKPYKKDIDVRTVALIWLPYDRDDQKAW
ncbi:ATP-binding protein [Oceaniferula spumae]|uniref:ATP-binding protein n=1 Tax=Oceaniferula spumae TaxID=2979115 RepID=A0AAT9FJI8_9BACT